MRKSTKHKISISVKMTPLHHFEYKTNTEQETATSNCPPPSPIPWSPSLKYMNHDDLQQRYSLNLLKSLNLEGLVPN